MGTIGFIGGGNMAEALVKGIVAAKIYKPQNILVSDIRQERLKLLAEQYGIKPVSDNASVAANVDILVLAVKPQNMTDALQSIKGALKKDVLVISIAAGKKISGITGVLGDVAMVRVMPNTPALIGEGASALFANEKAKPMLKKAEKIFYKIMEEMHRNQKFLNKNISHQKANQSIINNFKNKNLITPKVHALLLNHRIVNENDEII